jgi:hypothetical protein
VELRMHCAKMLMLPPANWLASVVKFELSGVTG